MKKQRGVIACCFVDSLLLFFVSIEMNSSKIFLLMLVWLCLVYQAPGLIFFMLIFGIVSVPVHPQQESVSGFVSGSVVTLLLLFGMARLSVDLDPEVRIRCIAVIFNLPCLHCSKE
jgi:hypothetical protein